jgi:PAS domain S-box-containing protein
MADQKLAKRMQARIVACSALGIFAVGTIVALVGILPLAMQLREAEIKSLQVDLRKRTENAEDFLTRAKSASQSRSTRGPLRESMEAFAINAISSDQLQERLAEWMRNSIGISTNSVGICILDPRQQVVRQSGIPIPREFWRVPDDSARDAILLGPVRIRNEPMLVSSAPILGSRFERLGTSIVLYRMANLQRVVEDYSGLGRFGETVIGDLKNREFPFFFPFRPGKSGEPDDSKKSEALRRALELGQAKQSGTLMPSDLDGARYVIAYGPMEGVDWGIALKVDERELLSSVNHRLAVSAAIIVALLLLGTLGMIVLVRPLAGRLILHTDELESQIYEKTAALNTELAERKRAELQVRDSEALYHSLVDTLPVSILRKDLKGRVTYGNRSYCEKMRKPLSELVGKTDFDLFPRDFAEKYARDDDKVITTGEMFEDIEGHRTGDGKRIYVHVLKAPVRDARGAIVGTQIIFWDVTARKLAEEALEKAATELARSNKELEQFAYVASHDLQEPLRMITSYTQLVGKRYSDKLDTNAKEFMQFAVDGAMRMQRLIQDLLIYSRVGTRGKPFEQIRCGQVLDNALANLRIAIEESGTQITHDELPSVMGDSVQLTQLFQNLIGNAIKFRGQGAPKIHICATRRTREEADDDARPREEWVVCVRDNGLGIEPQYFDRIFVIFQRLHTQDQYPGTGIGLAICRKIIERHSGKIWVESAPGQGSNFFFTLPVID